jgi:competence protein ComEA
MRIHLSALVSALIISLSFAGATFAQDTVKVAPRVKPTRVAVNATGQVVNINTANAKELTSLKGIGKALAERIIADRKENGPFSTPEDLTRVKGIGKKTLEKNQNRIITDSKPGDQADKKPLDKTGKKLKIKKMMKNAPNPVKKAAKSSLIKQRKLRKAKKLDPNSVD